ncbi:MAG: hypothetical protein AAF423_10230 [Pseudomonadota bacterium]
MFKNARAATDKFCLAATRTDQSDRTEVHADTLFSVFRKFERGIGEIPPIVES